MKFSILNILLLTLTCAVLAAWLADHRIMLGKVKAESQRQNDVISNQYDEVRKMREDIDASSDAELRRYYALHGKDYSSFVNEIIEKP